MSSSLVLAFDPGVTTGYCVGRIDDEASVSFVAAGQEQFSRFSLYGMLESLQPVHVIAETFEYRQHDAQRTGTVLESRNVLGVLELWSEVRDVRIYYQSPSRGKAFWKNDKIRKLGLYVPGLPHGMDATRHFLSWASFGAGTQYQSPYRRYGA